MSRTEYAAKKRAFSDVWSLMLLTLQAAARWSECSETRQAAAKLAKQLKAKRPELAPKKPKSSLNENRTSRK